MNGIVFAIKRHHHRHHQITQSTHPRNQAHLIFQVYLLDIAMTHYYIPEPAPFPPYKHP